MQRPPVEIVGYKPAHNSSRLSTCAASSITKRDKASERPASPEVDVALICDPFESSNEALLSIEISAKTSHSGRFFMIALTFLTRFAAVANLVAITRMFLSR